MVGALMRVQAHRQCRRSCLRGLRQGKVSHHELAARLSLIHLLQSGWGGEERNSREGMCSSKDVGKVRRKGPSS